MEAGIFRKIWIYLFGSGLTKCAVGSCGSQVDPRCRGRNCTEHCKSVLTCNGSCQMVDLLYEVCYKVATAGHALSVQPQLLEGRAMDGKIARCIRCRSCGHWIATFDNTNSGHMEAFIASLGKFPGSCKEEQVRHVLKT